MKGEYSGFCKSTFLEQLDEFRNHTPRFEILKARDSRKAYSNYSALIRQFDVAPLIQD